MEKVYKVSKRLLLMYVTTLSMIACDKGDDQPKLDTSLLLKKQWQLNKILVNENRQEFEDPITSCEQDNTVEFKPDKIFIRFNGEDKCNQEADSETGQWSISQEPKTLIFENIEYQVLDLSSTNLDLQRSLQGAEGDVIVKYYYISL